MEDVWLINKIDSSTPNTKTLPITFAIANIGSRSVQERVFQIVSQISCCKKKDVTIKYYGLSVELEKRCIPILIREFCEQNIEIYGVYSIYSDD